MPQKYGEALLRCRKGFANHDYETCVQEAIPLLQTGADLQLIQIFLISLQRLGRFDVLNQVTAKILASTADKPWENALLRLTLGLAEASEVLALATDTSQQCAAHFYAGSRLVTLEDRQAAVEEFDACLASNHECWESQIAWLEKQFAASAAPQLSAGDPVQQIKHLDANAGQLVHHGQYQQAINIASQAFELFSLHFGEGHHDYTARLNNLAELHSRIGNFIDSEKLYRQGLESIRKTLGDKHPGYSKILNNLGMLFYSQRKYSEAEPLLRQSLEIRRRDLGENHPSFATVLNNLAGLYHATGNFDQAELFYRQAMEIRRTALGENHPDYAQSLNNLAGLCEAMGNFVDAQSLYLKALDITRASMGRRHPDYVNKLLNLAHLYESMAKYPAAEDLSREALGLLRESEGESHPKYLSCLNTIARLNALMGNYVQAELLCAQTLEIMGRTLGEEHPDYAAVLNNMGELFFITGKYSKAESLFQQASEIVKKSLGENSAEYVTCRSNLASLYRSIYDYNRAESLYLELVQLMDSCMDESYPKYAGILNDFALLYHSMRDYTSAERLHRRALQIRQKVRGYHHPDCAASLNNLAEVYTSVSKYSEAETLFLQALEIVRRSLGENHPYYATSLNSLAGLYLLSRNNVRAEQLCKEALEIRRRSLGEDHPLFGGSLLNLAIIHAAADRYWEAFELMCKAANIDDQVIGQIFSFGSENQRLTFLQTTEVNFAVFLSLVFQHFSKSSEAIRVALDLVLRRKAIVAEGLAAQRDAVLGGKYPNLKSRLEALTTLRRQIAQRSLAGPGSDDLLSHQKLMEEWTAQKELLEAELARQIPEMNLELRLRAADSRAVASALPEGSVLIEYVRFNVFEYKAVALPKTFSWKPAHYLAFVLVPSEVGDQIQMFDLGEADPIDRMIAEFRTFITAETEMRSARDLGAVGGEQPRPTTVNAGDSLRRAVFDPILTAIGTHKRLFLAPASDLTRLPFEVLPTDSGRFMIDDYQISYLSTGRDVLRFGSMSADKVFSFLLLADPDFNLEEDAQRVVNQTNQIFTQQTQPFNTTDETSPLREDFTRSGSYFSSLPGTRVEGERIGVLLHVQPLLGRMALETQLKTFHSPHILHIATHGFFLADELRDAGNELLEPGTFLPLRGSFRRLFGQSFTNPLLRSGLALAGVNTWLRGKSPPAEAEDGILTAEDVSGLDLLATELVVLSACETGLGQVHTGEGVFGLRRAFVLAGARTLIMSLWKVPDQQTQELMENFYQRLLVGEPRADALRGAQLTLKAKHSDPVFWGAFICQGDPRPLQF